MHRFGFCSRKQLSSICRWRVRFHRSVFGAHLCLAQHRLRLVFNPSLFFLAFVPCGRVFSFTRSYLPRAKLQNCVQKCSPTLSVLLRNFLIFSRPLVPDFFMCRIITLFFFQLLFPHFQKSAAFEDVHDKKNVAARERRKREEMSHRYRG